METVYLEVTLQLVSKTSSSLSSSQAKALEDLVFDWVLHAEKFVDSRFLDLMKARAKVSRGGNGTSGALKGGILFQQTERHAVTSRQCPDRRAAKCVH